MCVPACYRAMQDAALEREPAQLGGDDTQVWQEHIEPGAVQVCQALQLPAGEHIQQADALYSENTAKQ